MHNSVMKKVNADPECRAGNLFDVATREGVRETIPDVGIGECCVAGSLVFEVYAKQDAFEKGNHQINLDEKSR